MLRAAGCVLWRPAHGGPPGRDLAPGSEDDITFAVVHRPKWDDWSHPKGKLTAGECARDAAIREVREETGMACVLGAELSTSRYEVDDRPKEVVYWIAQAVEGVFTPNDEVDELSWLPPAEARARLTLPRDRVLLDEALRLLRSGARGS